MDFYGYPAYQYDQSGELAKQMYAHQALASPLPYDRDSTGPHVMPAPSGSPWNMHGISWGMPSPPQVVQFTGQMGSQPQQTIHCKRKSLDVEPVIPAKQLITEEKMAAHLNGLHISSDYTPHKLASDDVMEVNMESTGDICEKLKGHTIVLSEEVKKLKDEPLLPSALLERLEKPQMSLVVWKPKESIIGTLKVHTEESEDEEPKRRNGVLVAEPSGMDMEM